MNAPTETTRTHGLRADSGTAERTLEDAVRQVAALDFGLLGAMLLVTLAAGYAAVVMPAGLVLLLGGFAVAVTLASALPFAVVRAVGATQARAA